jgi:hypothetical protein
MAFDPVRVRGVLDGFGNNVIAKAKQNLDARGVNASYDLRDQKMRFAARVMPNSISLKFDLGEYGEGIDQGVGGTQNPIAGSPFRFKKERPSGRMVSNIVQWASDKGVTLKGNNSKQVSFSAFMMASYILRNGIRPTRFFSDAYEEYFKQIPDDIAEAFGLDVEDFFKFIFKK